MLLLFSQFILFIGVGAVIPSIPLYGKELGYTGAANGIVISTPAVALLLGAKWGGNFSDRQGRKPAMLWGMALIALADLGTALAGSLSVLVLARLALGAGRCISESGERGMLADLAGKAPSLRGRALALQQAVYAIGIAIGAPLGGLVVEEYGARAAFLCVSAAATLAFLLYLLLPETSALNAQAGENLASAKKKRREDVEKGNWIQLLKNRQWLGLALCQCGASFGVACKIASIPILAAAVLPGGAAGAGFLVSAAGLSGLIGAPIGGWLTDKTSARSTVLISGVVSAAGLLLVPFALSCPTQESFVMFGQSLTFASAAFCAVVLGWSVGAAAQGPALTAYAQELAPVGAEATALALPRAAGDGTYIFAPFLLGLVADNAGTLHGNVQGIECAAAGLATLVGVTSLATLTDEKKT